MTLKNLSIIIPTHNRAAVLAETLASYLEQGCGEIVVVDDASTDDTAALLLRAAADNPELRIIRHPRRSGAPACRNSGAAAAGGEYIIFGEDDLRFSPDYAATLLRCLTEQQADVAAGRLIYLLQGERPEQALDRSDARSGRLLNTRLLIADLSLPLKEDIPFVLLHACSLMKRSVWERIRYDEDYPVNGYREESDFYVRCSRAGYRLIFCPHTVCYHLPRESVTAGGQWRGNPWGYRYWSVRNNIRFLRRHYDYLRRELDLRQSFRRLVFNHLAYEGCRAATYLLRHRWPGLYNLAFRAGKR